MPLRSRDKSNRVTKELTVLNTHGLHARPAAEWVSTVQTFRSEIWIVLADGTRVQAGRIMDVLLAKIDRGTRFTIEAEGSDAEEAVDRLEKLLAELQIKEQREEKPPARGEKLH